MSKIVGNNFVTVEPSEDGTEMVTNVRPISNFLILKDLMAMRLELARLQAGARGKAGDRKITVTRFGGSMPAGMLSPEDEAIAKLAGMASSGIIGGDITAKLRADQDQAIFGDLNVDKQVFAQQEGPEKTLDLVDKAAYIQLVGMLLSGENPEILQQLMREAAGIVGPFKESPE